MSLRNNGIQLASVTKEVLMKWRETREHWQDGKSEEFDHRYMAELQSNVDRALIVIDELDKIISKIKKDCE